MCESEIVTGHLSSLQYDEGNTLSYFAYGIRLLLSLQGGTQNVRIKEINMFYISVAYTDVYSTVPFKCSSSSEVNGLQEAFYISHAILVALRAEWIHQTTLGCSPFLICILRCRNHKKTNRLLVMCFLFYWTFNY